METEEPEFWLEGKLNVKLCLTFGTNQIQSTVHSLVQALPFQWH